LDLTISDLPTDVWTHILCDLVDYDIMLLRTTNKRIYKISNSKFKKLEGTGVMTVNYFAELGASTCLQYCYDLGAKWDSSTITAAASKGQVETIKFLASNGCNYDTDACDSASAHGHLECLKYLHDNGFPWDSHSTVSAAGSDQLEILTYLHQNGCAWSSNTLLAAARYSIRCLEYLFAHDCPKEFSHIHLRLCVSAAEAGNLDCLKFLFERGHALGNSCARAALGGHLHCMKYAHDNGGEWGTTIANAAERGHVECLKYALETGGESAVNGGFGRSPIEGAVFAGSIESVK
jgi:hypothetical protein